MIIKINGAEIAEYPQLFSVTQTDIDSENSGRTADGTLNRDRIAVKRKIEMEWGLLDWNIISKLLKMVEGVTFSVYYPDPYEGTYKTITAYVSDRPALAAVSKGDEIKWSGLKFSIVEV